MSFGGGGSLNDFPFFRGNDTRDFGGNDPNDPQEPLVVPGVINHIAYHSHRSIIKSEKVPFL